MSAPTLEVQLHYKGKWHNAAQIKLVGNESEGTHAATRLEYEIDYAEQNLESALPSVSLKFPVSFEPYELNTWPPFLLDLFPQGQALKFVEKYYKIPDSPQNYWKILSKCPMSPPGNLRIRSTEMIEPTEGDSSIGFALSEVLKKGPEFLEHMIRSGAPVSGSTGATGAAPKFLLRENHEGLFFADGVLPDNETKRQWFVKFPRGHAKIDAQILQTEGAILKAAQRIGMNVFGKIEMYPEAMFMERFDRSLPANELHCNPLESFYSAVGSVIFGEFRNHEDFLQAIAIYSSTPEADLAEYLVRHAFSVMTCNTDNHGRNSSFMGTIAEHINDLRIEVSLSPLYDTAPMAWDPEGVVRTTRWIDSKQQWSKSLAELIKKQKLSTENFCRLFSDKIKILYGFWNALEAENATKIFLSHKISEVTMREAIKESEAVFKLFRNEAN
jgi:serine/threonine-protein kinase HipA